MASGPITAGQIEGEKVQVGTDFLFLGSRITADSDCSHEIKTGLLLGRKMMTRSPYNLVTKRQTKSGSVSCS